VTDTIFALSSGRPPAAIALIRVSGPQAIVAVMALAGPLPPPRRAGVRALRDGGRLLDRALVLVFPGPGSATGEDLVEVHAHGGRAVVAAIEAALAGQGLRRAEAGEFTRRALIAGRIDLAEAHGLADLLEAETEAERRAAIDAVEGRVSRAVRGWLDRLAGLSARVEAALDFGDEDDVGGDATLAGVEAAAQALAAELRTVLTAPSVERLRDGIRVVIGGPPNAGKSTLFNLLAEREAAIVSPVAGTTRDRIEAHVVRGGVGYLLVDTAGLTETSDPVEAIGVDRAEAAITTADLLLWLADDAPPPVASALWVHARADLPGRTVTPEGPDAVVARSAPDSVDALWNRIAAATEDQSVTSDSLALHEQQRRACSIAVDALGRDGGGDAVLLAENLRVAHRSLAGIIGIDATEAMLDSLFGRFCIGK